MAKVKDGAWALALMDLEPWASFEEAKARYRQLVRQWHPDVHGGDPRAEAKTKQLNEAFSIVVAELAVEPTTTISFCGDVEPAPARRASCTPAHVPPPPGYTPHIPPQPPPPRSGARAQTAPKAAATEAELLAAIRAYVDEAFVEDVATWSAGANGDGRGLFALVVRWEEEIVPEVERRYGVRLCADLEAWFAPHAAIEGSRYCERHKRRATPVPRRCRGKRVDGEGCREIVWPGQGARCWRHRGSGR